MEVFASAIPRETLQQHNLSRVIRKTAVTKCLEIISEFAGKKDGDNKKFREHLEGLHQC